MGHGWQRSAVAAVALVGAVLASFNACSLDSNGLGPIGADGAAPDVAITVDGTLDTSPDTSPLPEAAPDVVHGDGAPCATIETDCIDGVDNDCNGLTDCADPACTAGYSCVPAATGGFAGFSVYIDSRATPCPAAYSTQSDTYEDLIFVPATCSSCTCTAQGAACGAATLTCNGNAGAACSTDGGTSALLGEACSDLDAGFAVGPTTSCVLGVPAATPGSCVAGGGSAALSTVSFGKLSRVCAATEGPGGGCGAGSVCVAKAPTGSRVCVSKATDSAVSCPAGYPSAKSTMPSAASFNDTRGCTGCGCGDAVGAACSGAATLYPGAGCTSGAASDAGGSDAAAPPSITIPADGNCRGSLVAAAETFASGELDAGVVSQGTCTPDGGQATGAVTPKNQTIYCCQP